MPKQRQILPGLKKDLEKHRGSWPSIAAKAEVSYSWIVHVMQGHTPNPRVQECQRVRNVLDEIDD